MNSKVNGILGFALIGGFVGAPLGAMVTACIAALIGSFTGFFGGFGEALTKGHNWGGFVSISIQNIADGASHLACDWIQVGASTGPLIGSVIAALLGLVVVSQDQQQ